MSDAPHEKRNEYLTAKQLAEVLQVSESTVHRLRRNGRIPALQVTDRLVRYSLKDVRRALQRAAPKGGEAEAMQPDDDGAQMDFSEILATFENSV